MTKRTRDTQLTREELEQDVADEAEGKAPTIQGGSHVADMSVLRQRKIVKVKRHNQADSSVSTEVLDTPKQFVLAGGISLTSVTKPAQVASTENKSAESKEAQVKGKEIKPTFSFTQKPQEEAKKEEKPSEEAKKLFGNCGKLFTPAAGGQFGGKKLDEVEKKPASIGLFGGASPSKVGLGSLDKGSADSKFQPASGGTFGGKKIPEELPKTNSTPKNLFGAPMNTEAPAKSLFGGSSTTGGLFGAKPVSGGGLFGSAPVAAPGTDQPKTSLFGSAPAGGLFGGVKPTSTLFGAAPPGSSVFSQTGNLFNKDKPAADDDDEGSDQEGSKSPPMYATENDKIEFKGNVVKNPYTKVFDKHVNKLKIVKPEEKKRKMDSGTLSIEYLETNGKRLYLTVFRAAMKPLFSGVISGQSRIKRVEEKAAKHQLKIAVIMTDPASKQRLQTFCNINFARHEDMISYEEAFGSAMKLLKEQGGTQAEKK